MIQIKNVNYRYKQSDQGALNQLSLHIKQGECVVLCGESGCGKTTVTRLLNGLIPHYYDGEMSGEVLVNGLHVEKEELYETAKYVGSVFQNPRSQFFCVDTTSEIAFGCENLGIPEEQVTERIEKTVSQLKIRSLMDRNIFRLSGGEKQKVACASVSAMEPDVYVLDEPTSNLDMDAIEGLKETITLWREKGKTIIIAEHRLYWLKELCDRVIYMKNGKIVSDQKMQDFVKLSEREISEMGLRALNFQIPMIPEYIECNKESIKLKDYQYFYGKKEALKLEDMSIPAHSIVAVTGHNGAGKSTFSRCICGLEKNFRGKTNCKNQWKNSKQMLKECYMVMQDVNHQLFCESVEEELKLGMDPKKEEQINQILEQLDLMPYVSRHPMSLSGGQKQRVAIASAVLADKSILIFDEPTSGLDYKHMKQTSELFQQIKDYGQIIFIITHDPELIVRCCTHVLHIEAGSIEEFYPLCKDTLKQFEKQFSF